MNAQCTRHRCDLDDKHECAFCVAEDNDIATAKKDYLRIFGGADENLYQRDDRRDCRLCKHITDHERRALERAREGKA